MELLFLILKIILIVLLVVVGVIVFLLCMILFVPIHYEVSGTVTESKELSFKGKITYCLSIVKLLVSYQNGQTDMQISLFGFRRKRKEESVNEEIVSEETVSKEIEIEGEESDWKPLETQTSEENVFEEKEVVSEEAEALKRAETIEESQKFERTTEIVEESAQKDEAESFNETQAVEETSSLEESFEEDSLDKDLSEQDFSKDLEESAQIDKKRKKNPKKKQRKKRQKKEKVPKEKKESKFNFAFIKQQLTDENNHYVVKKIWAETGYLLKHFGLRKIQTDLVFSAGNPALTGQILGILCMMPILYRYEFGLIPDFESEEVYIKGTFLAAGKIRLIHVCITAGRLVLDKKVRLVTKNLIAQFRTQ